MKTKTQSTFPLLFARLGEILKIEKIQAHKSEEKNLYQLGLVSKALLQLKEKLEDGTLRLLCNGVLVELSVKQARSIYVSPCELKEKNSGCHFCLHKGSCHG